MNALWIDNKDGMKSICKVWPFELRVWRTDAIRDPAVWNGMISCEGKVICSRFAFLAKDEAVRWAEIAIKVLVKDLADNCGFIVREV